MPALATNGGNLTLQQLADTPMDPNSKMGRQIDKVLSEVVKEALREEVAHRLKKAGKIRHIKNPHTS